LLSCEVAAMRLVRYSTESSRFIYWAKAGSVAKSRRVSRSAR
jgi:hypothetical protein